MGKRVNLIRYRNVSDHAAEHRDKLACVQEPVVAMLFERGQV